MATCTYWFIPCEHDSDCYSIREKTKREAKQKLASFGDHWNHSLKPVKVQVQYSSAFDLMKSFTQEGGCFEEWEAWSNSKQEATQ